MSFFQRDRYISTFIAALFVCFIASNTPYVRATTVGNCAEMGLALATIPFEIAAQKNDFSHNSRRAAMLHLVADTLNLANKSFFFYNNITAQQRANRTWTCNSRDVVVNATLAALDVKDLTKHFKQFVQSRRNNSGVSVVSVNQDELDALDEQEEISKLAYSWKVVALPCLKGLTAFALACTQEGATNFANLNARNLAIAAHSFTKLLAEYSSLETSSGYKTLLSAALMVNATWLVYEARQYMVITKQQQQQEQPAPGPVEQMPVVLGECIGCGDEDVELQQPHCGHAHYCAECLARSVQTAYNQRGTNQFDRVRCCTDGQCQEVLTRNEIAAISNNDQQMLAAYDEARNPDPVNARAAMTDEELRQTGSKRCPNPVCRVAIHKDQNCRHVTCNRCQHEFCWWCLRDNYGYVHINDCGNNLYGTDPNEPNQSWDYVRPRAPRDRMTERRAVGVNW